MTRRAETISIYSVFFLSGVAALLYQVIWTKKLTLLFGVTTYAVSTTLSVFMLGLALGSWYFGSRADKSKNPILLYCVLEAGIAAGASVSLLLLEWMNAWIAALGAAGFGNFTFGIVRLAGSFAVLIVPTFLMGGTLPVLGKVFVRASAQAGRRLGMLYAANTLGGVTGCLIAGFVLIPTVGLRSTLLHGVGINALIALIAYLLFSKASTLNAGDGTDKAPQPPPEISSAPERKPAPLRVTRMMLVAFFAAGFLGLAGEVVWTRMMLLSLDSVSQVFASILGVCLLGLALGSAAATRLADKYDSAFGYGIAMVLAGITVALSVLLWNALEMNGQSQAVTGWILSLLPRNIVVRKMGFCLFYSFVLLFMPCFCMGFSFPWAARFFARDVETLGRRLGSAYMFNTIGAMAGPLACGFWWLPAWGIQSTIAIISVGYVAVGSVLLAANSVRRGRWAFAGVAVVLLIAASCFLPDQIRSSMRTRGTLLYYEEDLSGSVFVIENKIKEGPVRRLFVGSTSMIADTFACRRYTHLIGQLPMLMHAAPRKALVICLGSGMTLAAVASHPDIESIDCVDLSEGVVHAAREYFKTANGGVMDDPRVHLIVNDGRTHLLTTQIRYDVICLEPPPPRNAGVSNLYSREFYELCRSRLTEDGMIAQWIPYHCATLPQLQSLAATMQAVFPTSTMWELSRGREYCVVGHKSSAGVPFERVAQRFAAPAVGAQLAAIAVRNPEDVLACFVLGPRGLKEFTATAEIVTDDLPGIGYDLEAFGVEATSPAFRDAVQKANMLTLSFSEEPSTFFSFKTQEARAEFEKRFVPLKIAWLMNQRALRLAAAQKMQVEEVEGLARNFVPPPLLDSENKYYRDVGNQGIYEEAVARLAGFYKQRGNAELGKRFDEQLQRLSALER